MKPWRLSALCVSIVTLLAVHVSAGAQEQTNLAAATGQIRAGDFFGALISLNRAVRDVASRADPPATLARVHAYRAWAYVGLDQPERAQSAVLLALKAHSAIVIDPSEFTPQIVALFDGVRHPARDLEAAGAAAEQAGKFQPAFLAYLNAFQSLPDPAAPADDRRLREKIITIVRKLPASLIVPPEATEHLKKANDLLNAQAVLGGSAATEQAAAVELRQALRAAPWSPDATFQLATVLQKLQRADEALVNLNLYKLADPAGYAATVNRVNPTRSSEIARPEIAREPALVAAVILNVYWPGSARSFGAPAQKVFCDDQHVAKLSKDRVIVLKGAPGTHSVKFRDSTVTAQFDAGKEYYLRVNIEGFKAHPVLHLADPDTAIAELRERQITPNDAKNTFSAECKAAAAMPKRSSRPNDN
jgi:tetratricopeptide (TPR) repeat protein